MKINDLIKEQQISEKPMGALANIGNKIASTFGSGTAAGKLETGKVANDLKKQFDVYLGKTGQQADPQTIIDFLSAMGLPTDAVNTSSTGPAVDMKTALNIGNKNDEPMAYAKNTPKEPEFDADQPVNTAAAKTEPTMGSPKTDYDIPAYQRKGVADPVTQPMDRNKFNQANLAAELRKRQAARKAEPSSSNTGFKGYVAQAAKKGLRAGMYDSVSYESLKHELFLTEALSKSDIDKIFLATAQLMARQGATAPTAAASAATPGIGSKIAGVAKSTARGVASAAGAAGGAAKDSWNKYADPKWTVGGNDKPFRSGTSYQTDPGEKTGTLNMNQLSSMLPNVDKQALLAAVNKILRGDQINQQHLSVLGVAFSEIIKADPQDTVKIMNTLKRVSVK
jgi:hypothetical protein